MKLLSSFKGKIISSRVQVVNTPFLRGEQMS